MNEDNWIAYDGECPFCAAYLKMVRLREAVGNVKLINVRENESILQEVIGKSFDIDEGMVLKLDGKYYYGSDAANAIALLSTSSGIFNSFNAFIFRSKKLSRLLYPVLKAGRRASLTLMGRKKILE